MERIVSETKCEQCGAVRLSWDGGRHRCNPGDDPDRAWKRWAYGADAQIAEIYSGWPWPVS